MIGEWKLNRINGNTDVSKNPIFKFEEGSVSYIYGNNHHGSFEIDGDTVKFKDFYGTKKYSPQTPTEQEVSQALQQAATFKVNGDNLTLINDKQDLVA